MKSDFYYATLIHAGLSDEAVSQTLDATRIVNEGIAMIEQEFDQKLESGSLGCYTSDESYVLYDSENP